MEPWRTFSIILLCVAVTLEASQTDKRVKRSLLDVLHVPSFEGGRSLDNVTATSVDASTRTHPESESTAESVTVSTTPTPSESTRTVDESVPRIRRTAQGSFAGVQQPHYIAFPLPSFLSRALETAKQSSFGNKKLDGGLHSSAGKFLPMEKFTRQAVQHGPYNLNAVLLPSSMLAMHNLTMLPPHKSSFGAPASVLSLGDLFSSGMFLHQNGTIYRNESGSLRPFAYIVNGVKHGASGVSTWLIPKRPFAVVKDKMRSIAHRSSGGFSFGGAAKKLFKVLTFPLTATAQLKYGLVKGLVTAPVKIYRFMTAPTSHFNASVESAAMEEMQEVMNSTEIFVTVTEE